MISPFKALIFIILFLVLQQIEGNLIYPHEMCIRDRDKEVSDLSGGQRTKVLLAKLLLEKPDILLLDEPTNYLDAEHIEWLKRYLNDYENAFILISHDIPCLLYTSYNLLPVNWALE